MDQIIEFISNHLILSLSFFIVFSMILSFEMGSLMSKFKPVTYSELTNLINKDKITLVDFRDKKEYINGHIIDSININLASIDKKEFNNSICYSYELIKFNYQNLISGN